MTGLVSCEERESEKQNLTLDREKASSVEPFCATTCRRYRIYFSLSDLSYGMHKQPHLGDHLFWYIRFTISL